METLIDLKAYPVSAVLPILLEDKTTKNNIIFATESYIDKGNEYTANSPITVGAIAGIDPFDLQPRAAKNISDQSARTKKRAEVMTPKKTVRQMVDLLEEENPGCYDDPDKTFIDLYMKSGLYIAEIVKRLFNSKRIKSLYPNEEDRLSHIFEKQVYGLAPTEIIYRIALAYVLGFSDQIAIKKHNLRMADAAPYAKEGKLEKLLVELYPEMKEGN